MLLLFMATFTYAQTGNTATGAEALVFNTTGIYNTADGNYALYFNTTGSYNTASGMEALLYNTTGNYNTASGVQALVSNTTGNYNTASGIEALVSNTTGSYNTASGMQALLFNSAGNYNTADGYYALLFNTTGSSNTASGILSLSSNTTGSYNTGVGNYALSSINTKGNDLTCIGHRCGVGADGLTNATAIGAYATVSQSNSLVLGGAGSYTVKVGIGTATPSNVFTIAKGVGNAIADGWTTYSSRRWKTNIHTLHGALAKVEQLRGVSYDLKANGQHQVGVIAEEVGAVVPEVVTWDKNGKDAQSVDYGRLTALLIEATKEQQALIHQQQEQIDKLASELKTVQAVLKSTRQSGTELRAAKAERTTIRQ